MRGGETVELVSDLGGGKTTFVRGLARGYGSRDTVASPTFTINKIYKSRTGQIHHFDFYRLNEPGVLTDQLAESLGNPKAVTVVEWSDIVKDVLPQDRITVNLRPVAGNSEARDIGISYTARSSSIIKKLETDWQASKP